MMQIDLHLIVSTSWANVIKTKIATKQMTYSIIDIVPSSCSSELSNKEDDDDGDGQWDGKTRRDHLPKVKVKAKQLGMINNKLHDHMQKELDLYFPFPNNQQLMAVVCDPVMLTLACCGCV